MRGSDIGASKAFEVARVLGVTMEELCVGTEKAQVILKQEADYWEKYRPRTPEEERYINKILDILRGSDEEAKITVRKMLDSIRRDAWTEAKRMEMSQKKKQREM